MGSFRCTSPGVPTTSELVLNAETVLKGMTEDFAWDDLHTTSVPEDLFLLLVPPNGPCTYREYITEIRDPADLDDEVVSPSLNTDVTGCARLLRSALLAVSLPGIFLFRWRQALGRSPRC
eukprot:UN4578